MKINFATLPLARLSPLSRVTLNITYKYCTRDVNILLLLLYKQIRYVLIHSPPFSFSFFPDDDDKYPVKFSIPSNDYVK